MTTINNTFKSKVMKAAWSSIRKGFASNLSQALTSAWKWAKKNLISYNKIVSASYLKQTEKAELWEVQIGMKMVDMWLPKSAIVSVTPYLGSFMKVELASWFKF